MNGWIDTLGVALVAARGTAEQSIVPLEVVWKHIITLDLVEALTFISFGVVCLFYGWRIFKILVTICFGLVGLGVGVYLNDLLVGGNVVWLAMFSVVVFAIFSIPLMRWGVTALGALSGGILTAGLWLALGLPEQYVWAGGLVGLIAGGMISFIVFKIAVILFTSLGGSTLTATGILAVMYGYMVDRQRLEKLVFEYPWFLPTMVLAPMAVGVFLQYRFVKSTQDWGG
ncbi:MAG TPA: hypothetical protein PKH24_00705 [Sedimentisphaerales bacterium]|jgi:hypothetical protein|nr:hypothetical protein [Sedimentisphaerales bacterium]HNU27954.1 hypothetical protein [Sedimentisphaerales bacterium]